MSRLPNDFQTYNSFQIINGAGQISDERRIIIDFLPGGRGGDGGVGVTQGQGGGGGTGEAPALNYDINSENFTMNFLLQDRWPQNVSIGLLPASPPEIGMTLEGVRRQFTGVARNFRHFIRARQTPYGALQIKFQTLLILIPLRSLFSSTSFACFQWQKPILRIILLLCHGAIKFHISLNSWPRVTSIRSW